MSDWGARTFEPNRPLSVQRLWRRCRMGGRASLTCAIEPPESHLRGHHSAGNPQQADHGDTEKGPGGTHSEQRATDQRTNYLNGELRGLEHALRARLLARVGHVTHLGVETRSAGDREHALDQAESDQPGHRRHERIAVSYTH